MEELCLERMGGRVEYGTSLVEKEEKEGCLEAFQSAELSTEGKQRSGSVKEPNLTKKELCRISQPRSFQCS